MEGYRPETYGERIAGVFDERYSTFDPQAIARLGELARGGPALELGIGTGRIALPLAAQGIEVHGVDASQAMVDRLRAKAGGERLPVTIGDFADVAMEGQFRLVYVVFNTFFALLTQEDQVRCFSNVARRLEPDGLFVLEAFVPDLTRYIDAQTVRVVNLDSGTVDLEASLLDKAGQQVTSQHVVLTEEGIRLFPVRLRYAWPSELDLMAKLAGLELKERWGGWGREPFDSDSRRHVSAYGLRESDS